MATVKVEIVGTADTGRDIILKDSEGKMGGVARVRTGGYLKEVWIRPDLRGRGYGRTLTQAAVALGAETAIVVTDDMKRLLESLGWQSSGGSRYRREMVAH